MPFSSFLHITHVKPPFHFNVSPPNSTKDQRPHLNALPPPRPLRRPRIHKRRMRHPGSTLTIVALQQQPLLVAHAAQIIPSLPLRIPYPRRLARAIRVAMLDRHDGVVADGSGVREGQGEGLHGSVEGPPDVDEPDAALQ